MSALVLLEISDDPEQWISLGFSIINNNEIHLNNGGFIIKLIGRNKRTETRQYGLEQWGFSGRGPINIGIPTLENVRFVTGQTQEITHHPNTVTSIDHVVLYVKDITHVKSQFQAIPGFELRGERSLGSGAKQLFFRPGGKTIIECVVFDGIPRTELWGITFVVTDIHHAKTILGETKASNVRDAIQKGRQILTIRHTEIDSRTNIALMTPHVKAASNHTGKL